MKTIYLILILSSFLFGQYGNNIGPSNSDFEIYTGTQDDGVNDDFGTWSETGSIVDATATVHGGTNALKIVRSAGAPGLYTNTTGYSTLTVYSFRVWARGDGSLAPLVRFLDNNSSTYWTGSAWGGATNITTGITGTSYAMFEEEFTTLGTVTTIQVFLTANAGIQTGYFDDLSIREKLATIYIDGATGNDANLGQEATPIASIDEADTRGYYSGGAVEITAGTYAENWDIDQPITINANGTAFTIDQIDFNGTATTIDYYVYNGATTVFNDENVFIINTPSTESILQHPEWKGWPDWE